MPTAEKKEKEVKIEVGEGLPDVTLSMKEATGKDYLELGNHKVTEEEYLFHTCVLLVLVDGKPQTAKWWEGIPLKSLHQAIKYATDRMPKYKESVKDVPDPLA